MEFTMESRYGKKTLADMSRALRKTTRKKSNRRSMIWAWVVLALNLLFFLTPGEEGFVWNWNRILNGAAALLMIFVILRQDAINGFFARFRCPAAWKRPFGQEGLAEGRLHQKSGRYPGEKHHSRFPCTDSTPETGDQKSPRRF